MLSSKAALSVDISVAFPAFDGQRLPAAIDRQLRDSLEICEAIGHGIGATLIVIAVAVLDHLIRRKVPWFLAG